MYVCMPDTLPVQPVYVCVC